MTGRLLRLTKRASQIGVLIVLALALLGLVGPVGAQTPDDVNAVARELWCPLCGGVRLDGCELQACEQMREVIALQLEEGSSTEEIKAYFIEQYGPQVLGEPPREGFNLLAWVLPFVGLAIGGGWLAWTVHRWSKRRPSAADGVEAEVEESLPDSYLNRVQKELRSFE